MNNYFLYTNKTLPDNHRTPAMIGYVYHLRKEKDKYILYHPEVSFKEWGYRHIKSGEYTYPIDYTNKYHIITWAIQNNFKDITSIYKKILKLSKKIPYAQIDKINVFRVKGVLEKFKEGKYPTKREFEIMNKLANSKFSMRVV